MDGEKVYMLKTFADKCHDATRDQHNFIMRSSSRVGFQGIRKIGFCPGSLVCPNPNVASFPHIIRVSQTELIGKLGEAKRIKSVRFVIILQQKKGVLPESLWSICHLKKHPMYIILGIISAI